MLVFHLAPETGFRIINDPGRRRHGHILRWPVVPPPTALCQLTFMLNSRDELDRLVVSKLHLGSVCGFCRKHLRAHLGITHQLQTAHVHADPPRPLNGVGNW